MKIYEAKLRSKSTSKQILQTQSPHPGKDDGTIPGNRDDLSPSTFIEFRPSLQGRFSVCPATVQCEGSLVEPLMQQHIQKLKYNGRD